MKARQTHPSESELVPDAFFIFAFVSNGVHTNSTLKEWKGIDG